MRSEQVNLTGEGEPERIGAVRVSAHFFEVLGVQPIVGRTFAPGTTKRGAARAHRRTACGSAASRRIRRQRPRHLAERRARHDDRRAAAVVPFPAAGELPEEFGFSLNPVVWTLDVLTPEQRRNRGGKSFALIGRLKPGVSAKVAPPRPISPRSRPTSRARPRDRTRAGRCA